MRDGVGSGVDDYCFAQEYLKACKLFLYLSGKNTAPTKVILASIGMSLWLFAFAKGWLLTLVPRPDSEVLITLCFPKFSLKFKLVWNFLAVCVIAVWR